MSEKVTFYKHTTYKPTYYEDVVEYFRYIPLNKINDFEWCDNNTSKYLDYVMIKYGDDYDQSIKKMKEGIELNPIRINEKPNKDGIFNIDLFKFDKAYLLASYHMKYTHIPAIISYEEEGDDNNYEPSYKRLKTHN
jgi:hypothetical protein